MLLSPKAFALLKNSFPVVFIIHHMIGIKFNGIFGLETDVIVCSELDNVL